MNKSAFEIAIKETIDGVEKLRNPSEVAFIEWYENEFDRSPLHGDGDWHSEQDALMFRSWQAAIAARTQGDI